MIDCCAARGRNFRQASLAVFQGCSVDKIPFTVYDFFAYLSSGAVWVVTADYVLGFGLLDREKITPVFAVVLIIFTYVCGQIAAHFSPQVFGDFIAGYSTVLWLMALGYVLHFLPHSLELKAEQFVTAMPMAGKVALTVTIIVLVIETKSAGIQPFIYFQF